MEIASAAVLRSATLILLVAALVVSCRKTVNLGGGYSIWAPASPDGQTRRNTLTFNGVRVCDNVYVYQLHGELIVFIAYVGEGPLDDQQLFVSKGAGPPVLISQRVVGHPVTIKDPISGKRTSIIDVEDLSPTAQGVRTKIFVGESHTGAHLTETHDLTWAELESLYAQGQNAKLEKSASGDYRILP